MDIKPTLGTKSTSDMGKNYEKGFNSAMSQNGVKLNEVDKLLGEADFTLKKKIFSLPKMEALVFSDPKLTAVYDEMSIKGKEQFGYHANETIQNIIFNDYVLNSPKYLQKYKMAIPKESKRRDKSGINQLRKAGEKARLQAAGASTNETTGAGGGGAGAFTPALGFKVDETTGASSSGAYSGPAAWGAGDLTKGGGKSDVMRKPIWQGGTIIQESNYLTDPSGFEKYVNELNEQLNIENPAIAQQPNVTPYTNKIVNDKIIDKTAAFSSGTVKQWDKPDTELQLHTIDSGTMDEPDLKTEGMNNMRKISTPEELKAYVTELRAQGTGRKGLNKEDIPMLAGQALYNVAVKMADSKLPMGWDDLPDINSMWDYIREDGGMTFEQLNKGVLSAIAKRVKADGYTLKQLGISEEVEMNENIHNTAQMGDIMSNKQREDSSAIKSIDLKISNGLSIDDAIEAVASEGNYYPAYLKKIYGQSKDMQETQPMNEIGLHDTVEYVGDMNGEDPFTMHGVKWQFVKAKYPDGKVDIGVYRFGHDLVYDYKKWREEMNINEESMIADNPTTMANKVPATGTVSGGGVPTGMNVQENEEYLNEDSNSVRSFLQNAGYSDSFNKYGGDLDKIKDRFGRIFKGSQLRSFLSLFPKDEVSYFKLSDKQKIAKFVASLPDKAKTIMTSTYSDDFFDDDNDDDIDDTLTYYMENGDTFISSEEEQADFFNVLPREEEYFWKLMEQRFGSLNSKNNVQESLDLLKEIDNELNAYSIHQNKLMNMGEDRKPSSLVLRDRLGSDNEKNFKKDLQHSGTKEIINIEKELMWKDQQTEVKDASKLTQDIEDAEIKATDAKGKEHLKNVGDSTNLKGDEIPKRNMTDEEKSEIDMYRLGQQHLKYSSKPSEAFETRMQNDMGDDLYKQRQEKLKLQVPMYEKDPQPVDKPVQKTQFNKSKFNMGLDESMVSGRYRNALNKSHIIDFMVTEVKVITDNKLVENLFKLDFTGLGNSYINKSHDNKVSVNEGVVNVLEAHKFYTDGKQVFAIVNEAKTLNENEVKVKPVISEEMIKMKHLLGYAPKNFVSTDKTKTNRGF